MADEQIIDAKWKEVCPTQEAVPTEAEWMEPFNRGQTFYSAKPKPPLSSSARYLMGDET